MKSNTRYWAERQADTQKRLTDKTIEETEEQLIAYYKSAMSKIISDFENTYNKLLTAVGSDKKPTPADLYALGKYWEMQNQLSTELQKLGDKEAKLLSKKFMDEYTAIYNSAALKGDSTFTEFSAESAKQVINEVWCADGKSWSDRVWYNTEKLHEELNNNLIHCVVAGKKPDYLKKLLIERFDVAYYRADCITRTEMAHIHTQAARKRYEDYGIRQVEILVDPDERTCPICGKMDRKRFPIGGKMPVPAHPNCRCCIIPVIEDVNI